MIVNGTRELAYVVKIDDIQPIIGSDNCECAVVGGWRVMVKKNEFKPGDLAVYFEIDSKLDPSNPAFAFLEKKHYAVKTQKYTFGGKGLMISQGLLMTCAELGVDKPEGTPLTSDLHITYYVAEDNARKSNGNSNKYQSMGARHNKLAKTKLWRWLMRREWGRKLLYFLFGKKKDNLHQFPTHFQYIHKTDQERCENMPWVLEDKTPYIRTQKCDGSSATYILERKKFRKFEFYVCSRNVRMINKKQECFYGENNYYWEVAIKYDIENKLKDYLIKHPELNYVCWQGEICAPGIQKNPHNLTETHFYCFHFIDSAIGKYDIREAEKIWFNYNMEVVPIEKELYILPDDFEEFKLSADGYYDACVCEGNNNCAREGFVYYKTTDPNYSFKNVSREYLLNK